jgi:hypothetical protein
MNVKIEISLDNSAFEDQLELERILIDLGQTMDSHDIIASLKDSQWYEQGILDINGNLVGNIEFTS